MISAQSMGEDSSNASGSPNKNDPEDQSSFKIEDDDDLTYNSDKQADSNLIKYTEVMGDDGEEEEKK